MPRRLLPLLLAVVSALPATAGEPALARYAYAQIHMAMRVRLVVYAPRREVAEQACEAAFERVKALDATLSDYRANSELSRLNASAGGAAVRVSDDLWRVLLKSDQMWRQSRGAFDASVGPVVALWRAARRSGVLPTAEARARALACVGWQHVQLDPAARTARLELAGMKLDLGGIAKGFIGDEAVAVLRANGCASCLFEAGGDIVLGDPPPGKVGWVVGFENGRDLELSNCGVAASGDTMQYVIVGGVRYSHVVDPRTGIGLTSRVATNVIAVEGAVSDGLSTAASVMGTAAGQKLIDSWPGAWGWMRVLSDPPLPQPRPRRFGDRGLL
ncbi:MAG: FAD:protein FMN transferase [Armatimonadetes bacterium]|nr:FAD:protein FMN transferase [Armatimonadota bacterium]